MKVLISGGTGFIGRHLTESLVRDGHEVVVLTRGASRDGARGIRFVNWDARSLTGPWSSELSNSQAVINLAGTPIGGRWTRRRMADILSSRLAATNAIVEALRQTAAGQRPQVLVSASGVDYYGDRGEEKITEASSAGNSLLAMVCKQWEEAAERASALGVRVVCLRSSLVFAREAPAFRLLTLPFRLFVGGPLGTGRQWFTWVHIEDHVGLYRLAIENANLSGPINSVAPDLRRQADVAREIGRVMHRPSFFPAPVPLLRLVLGRQADLLLHGRRALPGKATAAGYRFRFGGLHEALQDSLH